MLTERAHLAVLLAGQEARIAHAPALTTLHLLAGLLREEEGLAAELLTHHGVRLRDVRAAAGAPGAAGGGGNGAAAAPADDGEPEPPLSPTARRTLERAAQEARWLELDHAATEHVLLALLHESDGDTIRVLLDAGLSETDLRDELVRRARRRR